MSSLMPEENLGPQMGPASKVDSPMSSSGVSVEHCSVQVAWDSHAAPWQSPASQ